ncbi:MAG: carboxymuconolactone decarboxylase family protein [Betaproteobacteria bacterium]|nr:carboxymuconolactone decarboxylase family protein [Betaproteobacteria bacterium]
MARLPEPDLSNPDLIALIARIQEERGGRLLNLYRMLLHSPPLADGWRELMTAIRQRTTLSGRMRELVILHIAVINGADYEFQAHIPFALKEGITQAQIDALKASRIESLSDAERAVLAYAGAMTVEVRVPDPLFDDVRRQLNAREIVELTATIAAYNMVSRFVEALQIDHD